MDFLKKINQGNSRTILLKKNIIGSFGIKGISIMVSFVLVPLTLGYLSSELYGIWLTLSSVLLCLSFFDVGFTLGLKNKLGEAIALKQWDRGKSLVSTTYLLMILIFVPLCFILELVIPYFDWAAFLNVNSIYREEIQNALYILVACFCLQMIVNVLSTVIAAFQQVALSSTFPVIGNIISLGVIWGLTKWCPPSLVALAFAISAVPIFVISISSLFFYHTKFKLVSPSIKSINFSYIKSLWSLGYKFFVIQIQVVIMFQATNILISNVSGPNDVTSYNIAYKYLNAAMMVYNIILTPLWPAFTDAFTRKDFSWMNGIYRKMVKVFMMLALVMLVMLFCSPFVYRIWIGEKVHIPFLMSVCVCVYMIVTTWTNLQTMTLNGIGAIKIQTYISLLGVCIHIPLSFFLGKYIGGCGVVCSMTIITLFYAVVFTKQINLILKQKATGIWIK